MGYCFGAMIPVMDTFCVIIPRRELDDLLDVARAAAQQLRLHEGPCPLADALSAGTAAVQAELSDDDALVMA